MTLFEIQTIEHKLGYVFKDKNLLISAFTHSSYINENKSVSVPFDYDRLEFFGDSILQFIITEKLYFRINKDEGEMTTIRAGIVSRKPLAEAIDKLGIFEHLKMSVGAKKDAQNSVKVVKFKSNLFETVLAAIYIDSGKDLYEPRAFIERNLKISFENTDYKSALQEYTQKNLGGSLPKYESVGKEGDEFLENVYVGGELLGSGQGNSKKKAQQIAAKQALEVLRAR